MRTTQIQIRTDEEIKKQATALFEKLGLNITDAINLFLRQSIYSNGLPFEIKLPENTIPVKAKRLYSSEESLYTPDEIINEVKASMAMEGMPLTKDDILSLQDMLNGKITGDELRKNIIDQYKQHENII